MDPGEGFQARAVAGAGYGHTIMVTARILSRYQGPPPPPASEGADRSLGMTEPLYSVQDVAEALRASPLPAMGSRRCAQGWQDLMETLEAQDEPIPFTQFLSDAMQYGRWRQAVWCRNEKGHWFAADDWIYEFTYGRHVGRVWREFPVTYYLKLSITKTGIQIYMLSCHPSS